MMVLLAACSPPMPSPDGGSDAGTPDAGGPTNCQEPYRRCSTEFRFRALDEQSVHLRGDFSPDGWTIGVPMRKEGAEWVARAPVGFGSDVQYKFLINNTLWVNDPANPKTSDGCSNASHTSFTSAACSATGLSTSRSSVSPSASCELSAIVTLL